MITEIRMRVPGSLNWMVTSFDAVFKKAYDSTTKQQVTFFVGTAQEKYMLDGYSLVYGQPLKVILAESEMPPNQGPAIWLEIVEVKPLAPIGTQQLRF